MIKTVIGEDFTEESGRSHLWWENCVKKRMGER